MNSPQSMAATVIDICERVERRELNTTAAALALIAIGIDKEDAFSAIEQLSPKPDEQEVSVSKPHEEALAALRETLRELIFAPIVEAAQARKVQP